MPTRTGKSAHMTDGAGSNTSDLTYAPENFVNEDGDRVVFVDFQSANYTMRFDVAKHSVTVETVIEFECEDDGLPIFDAFPPLDSLALNGKPVGSAFERSPDGWTHFRRLTEAVKPGKRHDLAIKQSSLTGHVDRQRRVIPLKWYADKVHCIFILSDGLWEGGFLESYVPSNFEFDQFAITINLEIVGTTKKHAVFTNGTASESGMNAWTIEFPDFFTTSCPFLHFGAEEDFVDLRRHLKLPDKKKVQLRVYAIAASGSAGRLETFADEAKSALIGLAGDFGPYPHDRLLIFAIDRDHVGIEYAGATMTGICALRHEIDHCYFARCVLPSSGDSGWIDEAIAIWGDGGYDRSSKPPYPGVNIANRSPYLRQTSGAAYTTGAEFLKFLDYLMRNKGGLKRCLKTYFKTYQFKSVGLKEFQTVVETCYGSSLEAEFSRYVYGNPSSKLGPTPMPVEIPATISELPPAVPGRNPHVLPLSELFEAIFPKK